MFNTRGYKKWLYRDTFAGSGSFLNRVGCAFGPPWLLVLVPNMQPAHLGGCTLARDFGIMSNSANMRKVLKLMWPRPWCHFRSSACGSVAVQWWSSLSPSGRKSKVRGPCWTWCDELNLLQFPHVCLEYGWRGQGELALMLPGKLRLFDLMFCCHWLAFYASQLPHPLDD